MPGRTGARLRFTAAKRMFTPNEPRPSASAPLITGIEKTSEEVLGTRSTQIFSPLSFMLAKDMPREAQNFTYLRQESIAGRKTYCITGKMNCGFCQRDAAKPEGYPRAARRETLD